MANVRIEPLPARLKREFPDFPPLQWVAESRARQGREGAVGTARRVRAIAAGRAVSGGVSPHGEQQRQGFRWGQWKGLRDRTTVRKLVRDLCEEAIAFAHMQQRHDEAERLNASSTHWLGHSYANALAAALGKGLDARAALDKWAMATSALSSSTSMMSRCAARSSRGLHGRARPDGGAQLPPCTLLLRAKVSDN